MADGTPTVRSRTFSGRRGSQDAAELNGFIALLNAERVRNYGEVGARDGDTFHAVMCGLPAGSKGVALDLPGGAWGKETTGRFLGRAVNDLVAKGYAASFLLGDSTVPSTISQFQGRGPYDAILIDGDHRLPGVTMDWNNYGKMARIIAFHDIDGTGQKDKDGNPVEVPLLWASIKNSGLRTQELITPGSLMGIGVVWTR